MKKRLFNKKGSIMVEAIIALVIVSLVIFTAVSLSIASINTAQSAVRRAQAQHFAEDALVCFLAADNADQFSDALAFRGGFSDFTVTGSEHVYILSGSNYRAVAQVEYPVAGRATFLVQVTDRNGDVVASISQFQKGA